MARVIVITSGKGGVGKTTTTSNLGMALARLGHKTLLVDADVGLRNLDLLLGLENRVIYTGSDVLNNTCRLDQALIQDKRQPKLTFFPLSSNQAKTPITKSQIQELVSLLEDKYEFILPEITLNKNIINVITMDKMSLELIGKEGRKNIIKKFNVEKMCFSTYSEYKRLLN